MLSARQELLSGDPSASLANVQDAVLSRADRLEARERRILDAASIFPRRAESMLVFALANSDGADEALHRPVAQGLLQEEGQFVTFRHELARRAVESALHMVHKQDLNARVLSAIRDHPDVPMSRKLHHAKAAGVKRRFGIMPPSPVRTPSTQAPSCKRRNTTLWQLRRRIRTISQPCAITCCERPKAARTPACWHKQWSTPNAQER